MTGKIHSTETFGTVDGPGIRYVVFLKGCPMRCLYCHNPDTWSQEGAEEKTADEILEDYKRYEPFLKKGGLTVTGGEPLVQIDFVTELFEKAKKLHIHTCLDTSGVTFRADDTAKFDRLMQACDLVMLDIKHINDDEHKKLTGHSNRNILQFLEYLNDKGIPVWIRHVVVPGITQDKEYLYELGEFIGRFENVKAVDVLAYHDMGKVKYEQLGIEYPLADTPPLSKEEALAAKKIIFKGIRAAFMGS